MRAFFLLTLPAVLLTLCACSSHQEDKDFPVLDVIGTTVNPVENRLEVSDVDFVALDTADQALLTARAKIVDVTPDKYIVMDDMSRLVIFDRNSGRMLSQINHVGQGPGEYRWIMNAFVDADKEEIVLTTADGSAMRYTFTDSLLQTYSYKNRAAGGRLAIGSIENGFIYLADTDSGSVIDRYDINFNPAGSIFLPGQRFGYSNGIYNQAGEYSAMSLGDTVYVFTPEGYEKFAYMKTDGRLIDAEREKEINNISRSGDFEKAMTLRDSYLGADIMMIGDGVIQMYQSLDGRSFMVFYDLETGQPLRKEEISSTQEDVPGLPVEWEGNTFHVSSLREKDGVWHALVAEEELPGGSEANSGIVSFRLKRKAP